jgi:hypothetical protein
MGRLRIHETTAQRQAASKAALVAAGGARKTFRLSSAAMDAMRFLMAAPGARKKQTALIERLLLQEKARLSLGEMK